jgi:hypothetical protein
MLTHEDLQAIQTIVRTEVQNEVRKEIKVGLVPIIRRIKKIEKDIAIAIRLFDNEHHKLEERVVRLEDAVF